MKKALLAFCFTLLAVVFLGCVDTTTTPLPTTQTTVVTTDNDPVISGVEDVTIELYSSFSPLQGVTATDVEDGDLTSSIIYDGNVNPNRLGVQTATYTVTDSDGNVTVEERTITVVYTDSVPPLINGVADVTVLVGQPFDPLAGVSAIDTVDGPVTPEASGDVNVWVLGVYDVTYTAHDEEGNQTTPIVRHVTVGFGDFLFGTKTTLDLIGFVSGDDTLTSPAITGGVINANLAEFTYLKAEIKITASAAGNIGIALGTLASNYTELAVSATEATYVVYFILTAPLENGTIVLDLNGLTVSALTVDLSFAEARDTVDPVLNVPASGFAFGIGGTAEALDAVLRVGVTASDNIDGNVTSQVAIDLGTLDRNVIGVYDVVYSITDTSDNTVTVTRQVTIGNLVDSGFLSDPTFQNGGDGLWNEKSNDGETDITYDPVTGTMICNIINDGTWMSAAGAYLQKSTDTLVADAWYMFTFTVKSTYDRNMGFRMGLATDQAHGWLDDYDGVSAGHNFAMTSEFKTYNIYFKLASVTSSDGEKEFKIELNLGDPNYGNKGTGTTVTFKDVYIYRVVTEYEAPKFVDNFGPTVDLPTTFKVGDTAPDWLTYVTAKDMSQNVLTPTVDASAVHMDAAGTYDVNYSVTDSHDKTATHKVTITVVEVANADTVGPVIAINPALQLPDPLNFDQFTNYTIDYTALVTITDAVDGVMTPTLAMVNNGGLDLNKAGTYTVVYSCYDKSGNLGTASFTVTIIDKQAPVISAGDVVLSNGASFDPLKLVSVLDNVDGVIAKTNVTVTGLDAFMVGGFATVEGVHEIVYTVEDANHNIGTKTVKVTVTGIVWDDELAKSLFDPAEKAGCTTAIDATEGAYVISAITPIVYEWDQPARLVYYFAAGTDIVKDQTYKFQIRVKATTATKLNFRIGATVDGEPWIENFEGKTQDIAITTEYQTYDVVFTADKDMPIGVKFQFQFGYNASDATNTISIKTFNLIPAQQNEFAVVNNLLKTSGTGFNGTVENGATGAWNATESAATLTNLPNYPGAGNEWALGRVKYTFNSTVLEFGKEYRFAITVKADTATQMYFRIGTNLGVDPWFGDYTGSKVFLDITADYVTYYLYFFVDDANYPTKLQTVLEMSGLNGGDADNMIYIKDLKIESVTRPHLFDGFVVERFDYLNEEHFENVWTHRYGIYPAGNVDYPSDDFLVYNSEYKAMNFILQNPVNGGWDLAKVYGMSLAALGVTNDYKYLSFYVSNNTNVTTAKVWLHVGANKNAYDMTLPACGTSGWATIDVTVAGAASTITEFAIGFNNWAGANAVYGSLMIYDIRCVKDVNELKFVEIKAIPNAAPVVTMDAATRAALSGMTLKAGESIESLLPTLLASLSATDAEDGAIAITAANLSFGTLDPANPVMGSHNVTVTVRDSKYRVGTLIIPISIVTVLDDFEAYTDNADFQTDFTRLIGFRSGGTWSKTSGTLVDVEGNNTLQLPYAYATNGMNGIKIAITKAELEALGATYIGVYFKTSAPLTSTVKFQNYKYDNIDLAGSNSGEIGAGQSASLTSTGCYIFVPVSSLTAGTKAIAFMINVTSADSGTLILDNIVIK